MKRIWLPSSLLILGMLLLWSCTAHRQPPIVLDELVVKPPPHALAVDFYIRGLVFDMQGNVSSAISAYRQALRYDSTSPAIYLAMYEDYLALRLPDDALAQLYGALRVAPTNAPVLEMMADLQLELGRVDSALTYTERLVKNNQEYLDYRRNLAALLVRLQRFDAAIVEYHEILKRQPSDIATLQQLSSLYIAQKDYPQALELALQLCALDSSDDRACYTAATLLGELERPAEADSFFARTVQINPDNARYFIAWAAMHLGQKGDTLAVPILEKGLLHHGEVAQVWSLMGSAYQRAGQDSLAIEALDQALELDAEQIGPYITLGFIYDTRGEFEKAVEVYEQAMTIAPEDPLLLNNYAYLLAQRRVRLEDALRMATAALDKVPESSSYLDTMGWVYFGMGEVQKAKDFIEQALQLDPENADVLEHLGDVYQALGQDQHARDFWRKALELDPENTKIKEKMNQ